ncbi:MAG: M48 family metallopeptidase [Bdellovibrionales bacterium]|nr:M48 family metallopeptidase [Bdellovibrionales bacterium]
MALSKNNFPGTWIEHDRKVRPYIWNHRILSWAGKLVGLVFLGHLFFSQSAQSLEWWLQGQISGGFGLWLAYFGILTAAWQILSFPFSLGHYVTERRYGLSRQSLGAWFVDVLKGLAVGAVLGTLALGLLYLAVLFSPRYWWFLAFVLLFGFSFLLAPLAPVVLIPIFMTLKPMEANALKERLLALCKRFSVEVKDVYHLGLGEKTEKGNAAFMGLGRTKRIMIGDTLYEKYSANEVEAVFAHELGHQVHNDLWKGIGLSAVLMVLGFYLAARACELFFFPSFLTQIEKPFGLLIFFIVFSLVQTPFGLLQVLFSRARERAADRFAFEKIGVGAPLADALEKLTFQNWGYFKPNALLEFFTYSHPAPWRRILRIRSEAAA